MRIGKKTYDEIRLFSILDVVVALDQHLHTIAHHRVVFSCACAHIPERERIKGSEPKRWRKKSREGCSCCTSEASSSSREEDEDEECSFNGEEERTKRSGRRRRSSSSSSSSSSTNSNRCSKSIWRRLDDKNNNRCYPEDRLCRTPPPAPPRKWPSRNTRRNRIRTRLKTTTKIW